MSPLNAGLKRRHFLKVLGSAAVALALPVAASSEPIGLARSFVAEFEFNPFAPIPASLIQQMADEIDERAIRACYMKVIDDGMLDEPSGIRLRFLKDYTIVPDPAPYRADYYLGRVRG